MQLPSCMTLEVAVSNAWFNSRQPLFHVKKNVVSLKAHGSGTRSQGHKAHGLRRRVQGARREARDAGFKVQDGRREAQGARREVKCARRDARGAGFKARGARRVAQGTKPPRCGAALRAG